MSELKEVTCPVCKVKMKGEQVLFSYGPPGTKERLMARVCQYVSDERKAGCLLSGKGVAVNPEECYRPLD